MSKGTLSEAGNFQIHESKEGPQNSSHGTEDNRWNKSQDVDLNPMNHLQNNGAYTL